VKCVGGMEKRLAHALQRGGEFDPLLKSESEMDRGPYGVAEARGGWRYIGKEELPLTSNHRPARPREREGNVLIT